MNCTKSLANIFNGSKKNNSKNKEGVFVGILVGLILCELLIHFL